MASQEQGLLVVISGPSGVGKTTIVHRVREAFDAVFSVSATTRPKSEKEIDGTDYFFITNEEFQKKIDADSFLEHAEVFGC
ncbi:MAG TPA: guanylate kinase, partial [Phycisphaerales bacterium]|nr:guanylate kinase [Phycisphaerales bacterium]